MSSLIGKTILGVDLAGDKMAVRFRVQEGEPVVAKTYGDCCSETWIESLDTPELLIGGVVTAVEDLDLDRPDEEIEYGVIAFYGCRISTTKGACVIDYRNESNGYYGGSLSWPEDGYFYAGVYGQNISKEDWRVVAGAPLEEA